ncbi:MAG: prepilin-type N-terminal cleavage/methylation domain-containing protein [Methylotenera sp.]
MRGKSKPCAQLVADSSYALRSQVSVGSTRNMQCGMTLLELIIVVALLSIVALATTSLIVDTGEWKQQQATEDQWLSVKRSILGDNVVDVHYFREYSGFVADMGRLPNCLRELIRPFDCTNDLSVANRLTAFTQDIDSNQWYGWRGPYLGVPGANEYRDGWRNRGRDDNTGNDDDVNYGWLFGTGAPNGTECQNAVVEQQQPGTIILQSCGDDGDVDNTETGFPGDFPYVEFDGTNVTYIPLVTRHDYQVDLGASWINAPVKLKSKTIDQSRIIPANDLRLRVNYPIGNGRMPDWSDAILATSADRDVAPFLSATFPAAAVRLVDGTGKVYTGTDSDSDGLTDIGATALDVTVPTGTALSGTLLTVPNGASTTLLFSDTSELKLQNCPCEVEIDSGSLSSPTTLNGATTIAIKPDNIAPITADLGKYVIEVPQAANLISPTSVSLPNGATLTFSRALTSPDEYEPKYIWDIAGAQPTVTVSEPIKLSGDLVETDPNGDQLFLVPSTSSEGGGVITLTKAVPTIPQGLRNMTIVCESDGFLYDGDCTDNTTSYAPIAIPYQLEVSPRSYVPVPDEIVWDIQ